MDSFITKTLSRRPKNTSLSAKFRYFTLRHLDIINLPGSGEQLVLAGSTSSEQVRSQQLRIYRSFFYRSAHAPQAFSRLIRIVCFKRRSLSTPLAPRLAGIGISHILVL